jgi:hypothetical protein
MKLTGWKVSHYSTRSQIINQTNRLAVFQPTYTLQRARKSVTVNTAVGCTHITMHPVYRAAFLGFTMVTKARAVAIPMAFCFDSVVLVTAGKPRQRWLLLRPSTTVATGDERGGKIRRYGLRHQWRTPPLTSELYVTKPFSTFSLVTCAAFSCDTWKNGGWLQSDLTIKTRRVLSSRIISPYSQSSVQSQPTFRQNMSISSGW